MRTPDVVADKFQRLAHYLDALGIDACSVLNEAGLLPERTLAIAPETPLPAVHYSRFYQRAVIAMQGLDPHVPWAGGLGTDAFEMLCRAIIGCDTLGEALQRAERFSAVLAPVTGNRITVLRRDHECVLRYQWITDKVSTLFAPEHWYRRPKAKAVTLTSGVVVWHGFLSWLVGHAVPVSSVTVEAEAVSDAYTTGVATAISVTPRFNATETALVFPSSTLDFRVIQNHESLREFLEHSVLQLIRIEQRPASVGDAVKRLLGKNFSRGMPTFAEVAARLSTSESSLRRRLLDEETSFQALKDEARCELAKALLEDDSMRLSDIAEQLGFTEQSSFGRSFRQWTGASPSAWREEYLTRTRAIHGKSLP